MKPANRCFALSLLFSVFVSIVVALPSRALSSGDGTLASTAHPFTAADFDWREMIPALAAASELPGDQGVKEMLENSSVLRAYVVNQVWADCKSDKNRCAAIADSAALEREVTGRIDAIVAKTIVTRDKMAVVDYTLANQPFPFSEIAAYKSQKRQDAYFTLALAGKDYTSLRVKAKYGAPFDDDIFQWYGVYKYRVDDAGYRSEAVFEIDPTNDAVIKIAISLKAKKKHEHSKTGEPN